MTFVEEPGQAMTPGMRNDLEKAPAVAREVSSLSEAQSEGENENEPLSKSEPMPESKEDKCYIYVSQSKHSFILAKKSPLNLLLPCQFAGIISEVRKIKKVPPIPRLHY